MELNSQEFKGKIADAWQFDKKKIIVVSVIFILAVSGVVAVYPWNPKLKTTTTKTVIPNQSQPPVVNAKDNASSGDPLIIQEANSGLQNQTNNNNCWLAANPVSCTIVINFKHPVTQGDIVLLAVDTYTYQINRAMVSPLVGGSFWNYSVLGTQEVTSFAGPYYSIGQWIYGGNILSSGNFSIPIVLHSNATTSTVSIYVWATAIEITLATLDGYSYFSNSTNTISLTATKVAGPHSTGVLGQLIFGSFFTPAGNSPQGFDIATGNQVSQIYNYSQYGLPLVGYGASFDANLSYASAFNPVLTCLSATYKCSTNGLVGAADYVALQGTGLIAVNIKLVPDQYTTPINSTNYFVWEYWQNHIQKSIDIGASTSMEITVDYGSQSILLGPSAQSNASYYWCPTVATFYNNQPYCSASVTNFGPVGSNGIPIQNVTLYYYQQSFINLVGIDPAGGTSQIGGIQSGQQVSNIYYYETAPTVAGSTDNPQTASILTLPTGSAGAWMLSNSIIYPNAVSQSRTNNASIQDAALPLTFGCVGYYPMDEDLGTSTYDLCSQNTGTLQNNPVWTLGPFGDAINFSSDDSQYVTLASAPFSNSFTFSLSAWVNFASLPSTYYPIFQSGVSSGDAYGFGLENVGGTYYIDTVTGNGTSVCGKTIAWTPQLNTWYDITVTFEFGVIVAYVNGVPVGTATACVNSVRSGSTNKIGSDNSGDFMNGIISNLQIWNYALGQYLVLEQYQSYYPLLEYQIIGFSPYQTNNGQTNFQCGTGQHIVGNQNNGFYCADAPQLTPINGIYYATTLYYSQIYNTISTTGGFNCQGSYGSIATDISMQVTGTPEGIWSDQGGTVECTYLSSVQYIQDTYQNQALVFALEQGGVYTVNTVTTTNVLTAANPDQLVFWWPTFIVQIFFILPLTGLIVAVARKRHNSLTKAELPQVAAIGGIIGAQVCWMLNMQTWYYQVPFILLYILLEFR